VWEAAYLTFRLRYSLRALRLPAANTLVRSDTLEDLLAFGVRPSSQERPRCDRRRGEENGGRRGNDDGAADVEQSADQPRERHAAEARGNGDCAEVSSG